MMLALACCLSRISDYKHHWSDVLGGALLGTIVCLYTVRCGHISYVKVMLCLFQVFTVSIFYKKNIEDLEKPDSMISERVERGEGSYNLHPHQDK